MMNRNQSNYQQGIAVIEFALILPILMVLLLATAEIGRAFYQYNTLTKSIRDGARHLSDNSLNGAGVIEFGGTTSTAVKNLIVFGNSAGSGDALLEGFSTSDIMITTIDSKHLKVSASFSYTPIIAAGIPSFGTDSTTWDTNYIFQSSTTVRAL